jgi:hypothetical protein
LPDASPLSKCRHTQQTASEDCETGGDGPTANGSIWDNHESSTMHVVGAVYDRAIYSLRLKSYGNKRAVIA